MVIFNLDMRYTEVLEQKKELEQLQPFTMEELFWQGQSEF